MNLLYQLLTTFNISISHPKNYVLFLNENIKKSVIYFLVCYLIIGIPAGVFQATTVIPQSIHQLNIALDQLQSDFPDELIIDWDGTQLTSSSNPLVVPYPSNFTETLDTNLATIDTSNSDLSKILQNTAASTTLIVNSNQLGVTTNRGITSQSLADLPYFNVNWTVDKTQIQVLVENFKQELNSIFFELQLLIMILTPILLSLYRFWILLIDSLLGFLIFKVWGTPISYKKVLQLAIHVAVPVEVIHQLAKVVYPQNQVHLYSLGFWILFSLVIFNLRNVKAISKAKLKK